MLHLFSLVIVALVAVNCNAIPLAERYDTTVTTTNSQGETTTVTTTINSSPPSPPSVTFDHAPTAIPTTPAETASSPTKIPVVPVPAVADNVADAVVTEVVGDATIVHWPRISTTSGWPTRDRSYVPTVWGRAPIGRVREARFEWLNKRSRDY
ncbi:hypothetical protein BD413DRAFT_678347 [Trametes elegans]|nr:hypothetical protein BD413DRAFT_678347 [Trametes elegans]